MKFLLASFQQKWGKTGHIFAALLIDMATNVDTQKTEFNFIPPTNSSSLRGECHRGGKSIIQARLCLSV